MFKTGYDLNKENHLSSSDYVLSGALSSIITRATCHPLDVLKIRFQLQVNARNQSKYRSMVHACRLMIQEEGIVCFWHGHLSAQYLSISFGVFQYLTFENLTKLTFLMAPWTIESHYKPFAHFIVGNVAGISGTIGSYPFDVIRTRLIAQGHYKIYNGMVDACVKIMKNEGFQGFFKGIFPSLITIGPYAGFQFAFYNIFSQISECLSDIIGINYLTPQRAICGAFAGFFSKILIYPFDLIKKRLQIVGFENGGKKFGASIYYKGMLDCVKETAKKEGFKGFFKGLTPSLIKAMATTSLNFLLYESFLSFKLQH